MNTDWGRSARGCGAAESDADACSRSTCWPGVFPSSVGARHAVPLRETVNARGRGRLVRMQPRPKSDIKRLTAHDGSYRAGSRDRLRRFAEGAGDMFAIVQFHRNTNS